MWPGNPWVGTSTIPTHTAQLSVGIFDISVGQNRVGMREISKVPSVAMVIIQTSFSFPFFTLSKHNIYNSATLPILCWPKWSAHT